MKCRWRKEFEGVCNNDECPYFRDTCRVNEHPEVCKYAEEVPNPQFSAEELAIALRICTSGECDGCICNYSEVYGDCDDYIKLQAADMLEKLAAEKETWERLFPEPPKENKSNEKNP